LCVRSTRWHVHTRSRSAIIHVGQGLGTAELLESVHGLDKPAGCMRREAGSGFRSRWLARWSGRSRRPRRSTSRHPRSSHRTEASSRTPNWAPPTSPLSALGRPPITTAAWLATSCSRAPTEAHSRTCHCCRPLRPAPRFGSLPAASTSSGSGPPTSPVTPATGLPALSSSWRTTRKATPT
jgi:hypothetical protein